MKVKVILRNVGQYRSIITKTMYSMIEKCMTRCFNDSIFTASTTSLSQPFPKKKWRWSSHLHIIICNYSIDWYIHCWKHGYLFTGFLKSLCNKICSCRFPFCSCNTNYNHILSWISRNPKSNHPTDIMVCYSQWGIKSDNLSKEFKHEINTLRCK